MAALQPKHPFIKCSACKLSLPVEAFTRTQMRKGDEGRRCVECVNKSLARFAKPTSRLFRNLSLGREAEVKNAEEKVVDEGGKRASLQDALTTMGFQLHHAQLAIENLADVNHENAIADCISWMLDNPLTDEKKTDFLVSKLLNMGFSRPKATAALVACDLNFARALQLLLTSAEEMVAGGEAEIKKAVEIERKQTFDRLQTQADHHTPRINIPSPHGAPPSNHLRYQNLVSLTSSFGKLMKAVPKVSCFGDWLLLLTEYVQNKELLANGEFKNEDTCFRILCADNLSSDAVIRSNEHVLLQTCDGCFVGIEANGDVNSNRQITGHNFGPLMKWRALMQGAKDGTAISVGSTVQFQSALHNWLRAGRQGTCDARSSDRAADCFWRVYVETAPTKKAKEEVCEMKSDALVGLNAKQLWQHLRATYRLRVLNMQQQKIEELKAMLERRRKAVQERLDADEDVCAICWEAPKNAVILECGHLAVCADCGPLLHDKNCPICREPVVRVVTIQE